MIVYHDYDWLFCLTVINTLLVDNLSISYIIFSQLNFILGGLIAKGFYFTGLKHGEFTLKFELNNVSTWNQQQQLRQYKKDKKNSFVLWNLSVAK